MKKIIGWSAGVSAICIALALFGYASVRPKPLPPEAVNAEMAALVQAAQPDAGRAAGQGEPAAEPAAASDKLQAASDKHSVAKAKPEKSIPQTSTSRLDLNAATVEQLMDLPGIGESKAKAIVELRTRLGRFNSIEQLKDVKGIGDKVLEKLKPFIQVGSP